MIDSLIKLWNFSSSKQKNIKRNLLILFIEGFFTMLKMPAIIITINALYGKSNIVDSENMVLLLMSLSIIGVFITSYFVQTDSVKIGFYMVLEKRLEFGRLFKNLYLGFFDENSAGKINATLTTTLQQIEQSAPIMLIRVIGGGLSAISILIALFFYDKSIFVIVLIAIISHILIVNWQIKISQKNAPKRQLAQTNLSGAFISFVHGIKVIKAFSFKDGDVRLKESIEKSCENNISLSNKSIPSQIVGALNLKVFESIIIAYTVYSYFFSKSMDGSKALIILIFSFLIFESINQAGSILSMIGIFNSAMDEVEKLKDNKEIEILKPIEKMNSNQIELKNVSFSYGEYKNLKNITTTIEENSKTAIIGPSGSGKTTLCKLIPRFYELDSGKISIGGADIRHIETKDLMAKISMVFQNVYLFEDSIYNNIKFAKEDASYEEVLEASKSANCHEFIMKLKDGYETVLKEGGNTLSGGEKQRLSIARAILKNSPIIILDEATSALDFENENEILKAMDSLTKGKTVIMIAHRMHSIKNADHIIVLKEGEIVEEGNHKQLIAHDGIYKQFLKEKDFENNWKLR